MHALDPRSGCAYWSFRAQATVRTALLIAPNTSSSGENAWALLFGDLRANAYALDASTGQVIWVRKVDDHPYAAITGALTYYSGSLHVRAARAADAEQLDWNGLSELQVLGTIGLAHCSPSEQTDDAIAGGRCAPAQSAHRPGGHAQSRDDRARRGGVVPRAS